MPSIRVMPADLSDCRVRAGTLDGFTVAVTEAGELIHCFTGPLSMRATVFDLLRAPWYHPTLAEIITYPLEEIADQVG